MPAPPVFKVVLFNPSTLNLGNIPNAAPTTFTLGVENAGDGSVTPGPITSSNPDYAFTGFTGSTPIPEGGSIIANFTVTPSVIGADNTVFTSVTPHGNTAHASITANSVDGTTTTAAQALPHISTFALGVFPTTKFTDTSDCFTDLQNIGNADFNFTGIALTDDGGGAFTIVSPPVFPITLHPGNIFASIDVQFTPQQMGLTTGALQFQLSIGVVIVALSAVAVPLIPVSVLTGATFGFLLAYQDSTNEILEENVFDGDAGFFIFNGQLWGAVGVEKTLERLYVLYENVGVCTLTLTAKMLRPKQGPDFYDTVTKTITIGTVLADNSLRSGYFDIQATGEIMEFKITRALAGGPCAICGFVPQFDVKGEKVENQ